MVRVVNAKADVAGNHIVTELVYTEREGIIGTTIKSVGENETALRPTVVSQLRGGTTDQGLTSQQPIHEQRFSYSGDFYGSSTTVVAWDAGRLVMGDGSFYDIVAGTVTPATNKTHVVYFDPEVSLTAFQSIDLLDYVEKDNRVEMAKASKDKYGGIAIYRAYGETNIDAQNSTTAMSAYEDLGAARFGRDEIIIDSNGLRIVTPASGTTSNALEFWKANEAVGLGPEWTVDDNNKTQMYVTSSQLNFRLPSTGTSEGDTSQLNIIPYHQTNGKRLKLMFNSTLGSGDTEFLFQFKENSTDDLLFTRNVDTSGGGVNDGAIIFASDVSSSTGAWTSLQPSTTNEMELGISNKSWKDISTHMLTLQETDGGTQKISIAPPATVSLSYSMVLPAATSGVKSAELITNDTGDGLIWNQQWFNVKAYGAVGDGSTNDTAAIQAAVDAAEVAGGIVYFPPAEYKLDTQVTVEPFTKAILRDSGTSTGGSTTTLVQSGQNFTATVSASTDYVINITDNTIAKVTAVTSDTTLTFSGALSLKADGSASDFASSETFEVFRPATNHVRMLLLGWGAEIIVTDGITAFLTDGVYNSGGPNYGYEIQGFLFKGEDTSPAVNTKGVVVRDYDRVTIRNCRFEYLATGVEMNVDDHATVAHWTEAVSIQDSFMAECTTGVWFHDPASASRHVSFMEADMRNVGIAGSATGVLIDRWANLDRAYLKAVSVWPAASGKGWQVDGDMKNVQADIHVEGQHSGITGISIGTNAVNMTRWQPHFDFIGAFSTKISDSGNLLYPIRMSLGPITGWGVARDATGTLPVQHYSINNTAMTIDGNVGMVLGSNAGDSFLLRSFKVPDDMYESGDNFAIVFSWYVTSTGGSGDDFSCSIAVRGVTTDEDIDAGGSSETVADNLDANHTAEALQMTYYYFTDGVLDHGDTANIVIKRDEDNADNDEDVVITEVALCYRRNA